MRSARFTPLQASDRVYNVALIDCISLLSCIIVLVIFVQVTYQESVQAYPYYKPEKIYYYKKPLVESSVSTSSSSDSASITSEQAQIEDEDEVKMYCLRMTKKEYRSLTHPDEEEEELGSGRTGAEVIKSNDTYERESVKRVNEIKDEIVKLNEAAQKLLDNHQQKMQQEYLDAESAVNAQMRTVGGLSGLGFSGYQPLSK